MSLLAKLAGHAPKSIAAVYEQIQYSYSRLFSDVSTLADWLAYRNIKTVCVNMINSYDWIVVDLACQQAHIVCCPIPQFFSASQVQHLIDETQPCVILGQAPVSNTNYDIVPQLSINAYFMHREHRVEMPHETSKITFTSGSTGSPKGVCLSTKNQVRVATSLVKAIAIQQPKHLVLLPLATLLENIAGVYAPLLAGGQLMIPSDKEKGFVGSRLTDLSALTNCISSCQPNTMILVPELLQALLVACSRGWVPPISLQFIAVGGAKVDAKLITHARQCGLPVYQGYGLSECASVVSLCTPEDQGFKGQAQTTSLENSAGRILDHVKVSSLDGELIVTGNCFLGYLGQPESWYPSHVKTGDLVSIHSQYLFIDGRKKHLIINSFGRNISPEWIESKIAATGLFAQSIVVGEAKPYLTALLVPISNNIPQQSISAAISLINKDLPDYAHIINPIILNQPFSQKNGLVTQNGKLKRSAIEIFYTKQINHHYSQPTVVAV